MGGRTFPLAANFSAPFASLIEKTGLTSYSGLLKTFSGGEELLEKTGFFTIEPYRSRRIPLVFVHGLFSSPITWVNLQNDLMGDPIIREHYQIWSYLYPTNLPILLNAETFREKLDQLKRHLTEADDNGADSPGMVIIAHSMGGLLTKTAVVRDSEPVKRYLWESPEKIAELDPKTRDLIDRVFTFRVRPYVERVIFIAVPFLGSEIADNWVGWIGRKLVGLPRAILEVTADFPTRIRDVIRPELRAELAEQDLTSVKGLSPHNPALLALAKALVDRCVPYHLIEGDRGLGGGVNASDGVVPFRSSHLEGAESELVVPAGHAAFTHPIAVLEIKRILHEHVRQKRATDRRCE
jgi:pimeloyl-ACP methyl ester carboxylesterase